MFYRLSKGKSLEDAVLPAYSHTKSKYLQEEESRTLSELARSSGMSYRSVYARLHRGIPLSRALDPTKIIRRSKLLPEEETRTLSELAREAGMSLQAMRSRLRAGMPLEEALSKPPRGTRRKVGKYESLSAIAKLAGISRERVRQLINKGVDPDSIASGTRYKGPATKVFPGTPEKYQHTGLRSLAKEWKVPYSRVTKLYHKGYDFSQAQALAKSPPVKVVLPGTPKKYYGKTLPFIAKDLGVTPSALYYYFRKGCTYKEARMRALAAKKKKKEEK